MPVEDSARTDAATIAAGDDRAAVDEVPHLDDDTDEETDDETDDESEDPMPGGSATVELPTIEPNVYLAESDIPLAGAPAMALRRSGVRAILGE